MSSMSIDGDGDGDGLFATIFCSREQATIQASEKRSSPLGNVGFNRPIHLSIVKPSHHYASIADGKFYDKSSNDRKFSYSAVAICPAMFPFLEALPAVCTGIVPATDLEHRPPQEIQTRERWPLRSNTPLRSAHGANSVRPGFYL